MLYRRLLSDNITILQSLGGEKVSKCTSTSRCGPERPTSIDIDIAVCHNAYNFDFTPRIHHFFSKFYGGACPRTPLDRLRTFSARMKRSALSESSLDLSQNLATALKGEQFINARRVQHHKTKISAWIVWPAS